MNSTERFNFKKTRYAQSQVCSKVLGNDTVLTKRFLNGSKDEMGFKNIFVPLKNLLIYQNSKILYGLIPSSDYEKCEKHISLSL